MGGIVFVIVNTKIKSIVAKLVRKGETLSCVVIAWFYYLFGNFQVISEILCDDNFQKQFMRPYIPAKV